MNARLYKNVAAGSAGSLNIGDGRRQPMIVTSPFQ